MFRNLNYKPLKETGQCDNSWFRLSWNKCVLLFLHLCIIIIHISVNAASSLHLFCRELKTAPFSSSCDYSDWLRRQFYLLNVCVCLSVYMSVCMSVCVQWSICEAWWQSVQGGRCDVSAEVGWHTGDDCSWWWSVEHVQRQPCTPPAARSARHRWFELSHYILPQTLCGSVAEWLGRWTGDHQVTGSNPGLPTVECNFHQVVNTRASVTKHYNLVPANGRWYLAAGKVTVGLASHWPRVTGMIWHSHTGWAR